MRNRGHPALGDYQAYTQSAATEFSKQLPRFSTDSNRAESLLVKLRTLTHLKPFFAFVGLSRVVFSSENLWCSVRIRGILNLLQEVLNINFKQCYHF